MKGFDVLKSSSTLIKSTGFIFLALAFFYFGKHLSNSNYQQLIFFNYNLNSYSKTPTISISPNYNKTFNINSLINNTNELETQDNHTLGPIPQSPLITQSTSLSPPPPAPSAPAVQRLGLVDENGVMRNDFEVGEFDPDVVENWSNETEVVEGDDLGVRVPKFEKCAMSMREYIPCLDNVDVIRGLKSTKKGEKFERHCPEKDRGLNCLVPAPKGYKAPIPWPRSRDEVVFCCVLSCYVFYICIDCNENG